MCNLPWKSNIKFLIRTVLVLPANSADAERSFSIMNHIKNERRSKITSDNLDSILRLRINGPKQLDRFPSAKYARAWLKKGHMRTDDSARQTKRTAEVALEDDDEDTIFKVFMETDLF